MPTDFLHELNWRGLLHDSMPGTADHLKQAPALGYIGFDPTADSLHVGNLVQIMILVHFQRCGHKPVALVGGATGMVGDPSGKSAERNLLDEDALRHNQACIKAQLERFLDFNSATNPAQLVNNYDWFKDMGFLRFIREVGKHITVNYMMAKDSVKNRMESGISFTEFSYQLVQGYDFVHLYKQLGCRLQMGGSDQWGNITTGTELIRRMEGGEAFAVTTPLLTKSDGSKFGKSEGGNVWLDAARTSPYKFYQFWLNASDDEAARFAKIFTHWSQDECEALIAEHTKDPGRRKLQKEVAAFITQLVHGEAALQEALAASAVLFGSASVEDIRNLPVAIWEELAATLPGYTTVMDPDASMAEGELAGISRGQIEDSLSVLKLLARSGFLSSFGEAKRAIKEKSISVNGVKITEEGHAFESKDLIHGKYMLLQRGKKTFFVLKAV